jgi:hypothetical protein
MPSSSLRVTAKNKQEEYHKRKQAQQEPLSEAKGVRTQVYLIV